MSLERPRLRSLRPSGPCPLSLRALLLMIALLPCTYNKLVNVAVGRPSYQSSTYGDRVSSRAVDGNRDPYFKNKSCTHTNTQMNPWWAVDLQWRSLVDSVNLTNRGLCLPNVYERLSNVRIGTTDVSPAITPPTPSNIRICASKDPAVGEGATEQFPCGEQGRYLVVLLEGNGKVLTLCEVEVFLRGTGGLFLESASTRLVGHVLSSKTVTTSIECGSLCMRTSQCGSFSVMRSVSGDSVTCELNAVISQAQFEADLATDPDYTFYRQQ